tara:strand:- start:153 stop:800 length:648 start_codon:yes stop_codon:yes gene_type:complete
MISNNQKTTLNIADSKYIDWKICLKNKLKMVNSNNIEIDSKNLDLSCTDISEIIAIANQSNCKVINFCSTSSKTIVSSQALGYMSPLILENHSNETLKINEKSLISKKTNFHQGTVRSGEYLESSGDLVIIGDVNPGAKVSAEGNIIIWGRLLGIAHAGINGNYKATISALQLRPVQLRIAKKIARGPKEMQQFGLAEQAKIDSGEIIISILDTN